MDPLTSTISMSDTEKRWEKYFTFRPLSGGRGFSVLFFVCLDVLS